MTIDLGWIYAILVVAISAASIVYGLGVVHETWADLRSLRAAGQNGVLVGLANVSLQAHVIRIAQLALFNTAGWIVFGVVLAGAPPEGLMLSFSRSVTLANVSLTAYSLWWGRAARRDLAEQEAERRAAEGE